MKNFFTVLFFLLAHSLLHAQVVNFKWVRTFGSPGYDMGAAVTVDGAGNVYATGRFSGTIDFDPGPAVYNLSAIDSTDIFFQSLMRTGTSSGQNNWVV